MSGKGGTTVAEGQKVVSRFFSRNKKLQSCHMVFDLKTLREEQTRWMTDVSEVNGTYHEQMDGCT